MRRLSAGRDGRLLAMRGARVGIGHDIHRLVPGRVLTLGGVAVPAEVGFATPSDGDVLSHALIDALAGAIGHGDMGRYFPADSDPAAQGARSVDYVRRMARHVADAGLAVEHVDSLVTLGTVRLGPHLDAMRGRLASALGVDALHVSVKARSNDGLGPEGRGEAASASVTVLLAPAGDPPPPAPGAH
jgi:2-C-methyl-D-erythritol 2,4-cyclodiphosphate synthase